MGFSNNEDDNDAEEKEDRSWTSPISLINEQRVVVGGTPTSIDATITYVPVHCQHGWVESEMEFWPLEHPVEPPDEDQPVKCPITIPHSSPINIQKETWAEDSTKGRESGAESRKDRITQLQPPVEQSVRAVRKRHHTHTLAHGDIVITPMIETNNLPSSSHNDKITILQMAHQIDSFGS